MPRGSQIPYKAKASRVEKVFVGEIRVQDQLRHAVILEPKHDIDPERKVIVEIIGIPERKTTRHISHNTDGNVVIVTNKSIYSPCRHFPFQLLFLGLWRVDLHFVLGLEIDSVGSAERADHALGRIAEFYAPLDLDNLVIPVVTQCRQRTANTARRTLNHGEREFETLRSITISVDHQFL